MGNKSAQGPLPVVEALSLPGYTTRNGKIFGNMCQTDRVQPRESASESGPHGRTPVTQSPSRTPVSSKQTWNPVTYIQKPSPISHIAEVSSPVPKKWRRSTRSKDMRLFFFLLPTKQSLGCATGLLRGQSPRLSGSDLAAPVLFLVEAFPCPLHGVQRPRSNARSSERPPEPAKGSVSDSTQGHWSRPKAPNFSL